MTSPVDDSVRIVVGQEELDARSVNVRNDDVGTKAKGEMVPHPGHDNTASNTYKTYRKKSSLSGLKFTIRRRLEASSLKPGLMFGITRTRRASKQLQNP